MWRSLVVANDVVLPYWVAYRDNICIAKKLTTKEIQSKNNKMTFPTISNQLPVQQLPGRNYLTHNTRGGIWPTNKEHQYHRVREPNYKPHQQQFPKANHKIEPQ